MPERVSHPCRGRSPAQIRAFEAIAINQHPSCSQRTINALLYAGLIVQCGKRTIGRDQFGAIWVRLYEVPIPIHMQWCKWAAENVEVPE